MFEGPEAELTLTANAQPALMAVSLAAVRVLETEAGLDLRRDARLRRRPFARRIFGALRRRRAQHRRCGAACCACAARPCRRPCRWARAPWRPCSASSSTRRAKSPATAAAAIGAVCEVANDNGGGQVVHFRRQGGRSRQAIEIAKEQRRQARHAAAGLRALPLRADAARRRSDARRARRDADIQRAPRAGRSPMSRPRPRREPEEIRRLLVEQVTRRGALARDASPSWPARASTNSSECGAGKVLAGLVKRIAPAYPGSALARRAISTPIAPSSERRAAAAAFMFRAPRRASRQKMT